MAVASVRIGGRAFRHALIAGAAQVIARRDELNRINVFPVPDGDTGTNMAFTFAAVMEGAKQVRSTHLGQVLERAAIDAIDGARGNSGAIVAQFFQGLSEALCRHRRASLAELSEAVQRAAAAARLALAEPKEGTIISVIGDFAQELRAQWQRGVQDVRAFFREGLERARRSLADTPKQLAVLRTAQVFDAGASGFVAFLEGVQAFVERGRSATSRLPLAVEIETSLGTRHAPEDPGAFRYCSECLVCGEDVELDRVRAALTDLPLDSLVIAGGSGRVRVHAHLDRPGQLFERLATIGRVNARKADDIHAQVRARRQAQAVGVVVDSAADLPEGLREELNIHVVPVRVNFGAEEYLDRITLSADELYARLRDGREPARTSQPPAGEFRRLYELLGPLHEEIVSIQISSRLSGTFQAAQSAARHATGARAQVFDTRNAACGQALLAIAAAEAARAGRSGAEIIAWLERLAPQTVTYALIDDLRFGVRGGRIPAWVQPICAALRLKLMIKNGADGKVRPCGAMWARVDLPERFASRVARGFKAAARVRAIVGHCDALDAGERALARLLTELPQLEQAHLVAAGTAIGAHAGPGSLVIGLQALPPT